MRQPLNRAQYLKVLQVVLLGVLIAVIITGSDIDYAALTPSRIRAFVVSFGATAPFILMSLYIIRSFVLVPTTVLLLVSGLAFGPILGIVYAFIGELISAALSFWLARYLGRDIVESLMHRHIDTLNQKTAEQGFRYVMLARLVPLIPFDAINFGAGLSRMHFSTFFSATALGIFFPTIIYVLMGNALVDTHTMWFAGLLMIVMFLLPLFSRKIGRIGNITTAGG